MKRYNLFLISAALLALLLATGCQKLETDTPGEWDGQLLTFNASIQNAPVADTRAAKDDTNLNTQGFYLAGYHTEGPMDNSTAATATPNVFNKEAADGQAPVPLVKLQNSKFTLKRSKWELSNSSYLSFFGWSQNKTIPTTVTATTTGIIGHTKEATQEGYPWIDIRNDNTPANQTDIVGSRSLNHKNDVVLSAVDLHFYHLLSKLTFKAKSSSGAHVKVTALSVKYAAGKVRNKGRYTFGNDPLSVGQYALDPAESHSGTAAIATATASITPNNEVLLGSTLLLPQTLQRGDVSLEIKYKISPNGGTWDGAEQTKTIPLTGFAFAQGNNYLYTIDIHATEIVVTSTPSIEPWGDLPFSGLPIIAGPKGNTALLLDGYDKPYQHTNGKLYWLDRSGYNRHVELTAGYVQYDEAAHAYEFKKSKGYGGIIPSLNPNTYVGTFDLVAEVTGRYADIHYPFRICATTLQLPVTNTQIDWNFSANGSTYVGWAGFPAVADLKKRNFITTTTASSEVKIYHNAKLRARRDLSLNPLISEKGTLANGFDGRISYLRVTLNKERTPLEITADYQMLAKRFDIEKDPNATKYLPPVTDGLVFCFDSRSGIKTASHKDGTSAKKYWEDQVGNNDAEIIGSVDYYGSNPNYFYFNIYLEQNYMRLLENTAIPNNFTFEMVIDPNGTYDGAPLYFGTAKYSTNDRIIAPFLPYPGNKIYVDSPGTDRYYLDWPSGVGAVEDRRQFAIRRSYTTNKSEFFMRNRVVASGNAKNDISNKVCTFMYIGGHKWEGRIYAIRLYNRTLTDDEMKKNYDFDQKIFQFTY